jgi:hypothetical protein
MGKPITRSQDAGASRYQEYISAAATGVNQPTMSGFVLQGTVKPNGSVPQSMPNTRSAKSTR